MRLVVPLEAEGRRRTGVRLLEIGPGEGDFERRGDLPAELALQRERQAVAARVEVRAVRVRVDVEAARPTGALERRAGEVAEQRAGDAAAVAVVLRRKEADAVVVAAGERERGLDSQVRQRPPAERRPRGEVAAKLLAAHPGQAAAGPERHREVRVQLAPPVE